MAEKGEKRRSVKQKIRDTKRLLSKEDLPETVRLSKERVLKCLATERQERQQETREKKMNKKYRMVKFFDQSRLRVRELFPWYADRRKVVRKLKVLQREWNSCTNDAKRSELLVSLKQLRKELNYVVHFPSAEKYLALYPSTESTDSQALERKECLLCEVEDMVTSGELSDASSSFLAPDLLSLLSNQTSAVNPAHCSPPAVTQSLSDQSCDVEDGAKRGDRGNTLGKRKKIIYKAPVDEEPEGGVKTRKHLATEDDFFLLDNS